MAADDWIGISVPGRNDSEYYTGLLAQRGVYLGIDDCPRIRGNVYRSILERLRVSDVVGIEPLGDSEAEALLVKKAVESARKKPLILALDHSAMGYVFADPSLSYLYFDEHMDDHFGEFGDGTFINYMKGNHSVIGVELALNDNENVRGFRYRWYNNGSMKKAVQKRLENKVFQSVCVDVLHPRFTTAHGEMMRGRMSPKQIVKLSKEFLAGRELVGMNFSTYDPCMEHPVYRMADVVVDILKPML
jgi:arginase family enzyme